jgi:glutamate dehydrogenase/leucine dehydrogenase
MFGDNMYNIIKTLNSQLKNAYKISNIRESTYNIIKAPQTSIALNFPIRKLDNSIEIINGFRVQHNDALGPYKGYSLSNYVGSQKDIPAPDVGTNSTENETECWMKQMCKREWISK